MKKRFLSGGPALLAIVLVAGCAGPYPIQFDRGISFLSYSKTVVNVYPKAGTADCPSFSRENDTQMTEAD